VAEIEDVRSQFQSEEHREAFLEDKMGAYGHLVQLATHADLDEEDPLRSARRSSLHCRSTRIRTTGPPTSSWAKRVRAALMEMV